MEFHVVVFQERNVIFRYCIRVESANRTSMVLRERKWNIMSYNTGFTNYITGRAVVGHVS